MSERNECVSHVDQIHINKEAAQKREDDAYAKALNEIKEMAAKGQEYMTVQFYLPNCGSGYRVQDRLEKHGIRCCARGYHSEKQHDGSYFFSICFEVGNRL